MAEEKKIEVTIPEETVQEGKEELLEEHQAQAEEAKEEAEEHKEAAEEHKEEAKAAATQAQEAKEETQKLTSWIESVLPGLRDSINLVVQRMEQVMTIQKESAAEIKGIVEELQPTLELYQEQIGDMDAAANKVQKATAALILLHEEQTNKEN